MWDRKQHNYEEIRSVVIDILLSNEATAEPPNQWISLINGISEVFARREGKNLDRHMRTSIHPYDAELARDVFWDLFRQGLITLGLNDSNPEWPWFRLSYFGKKTLKTQNPYRFHDTSSYLILIKNGAPDLSETATLYLEEAVAAFYADCLLASCVMLGVAAEAEFLRLVDAASNNVEHGAKFLAVAKARFVGEKISKFQSALTPLLRLLPQKAVEDVDVKLNMIQSVLRIARNNAGHPSGASPPEREQVYVFLQLFVPLSHQLKLLRDAFA